MVKQSRSVFSRVKASRKKLTKLDETFNSLRDHKWVAVKGWRDILRTFLADDDVGHANI